MEKYVVALDVMGGDNGISENIKGAVDASKAYEKIKIILVGKEEEIKKELAKHSYDKNRIEIKNATEIIEVCDVPTIAIKEKKDSSIVVGLKLLKEDKASAFVSSGSTGALLTGATLIIKRIKGIERPALASLVPNEKGGYTFLVDAGANMECKASYLPSFAKMGKIYVENLMGVQNAKVGIINVGSEKGKGDTFTKEAYELLENTPSINFVGNAEGREVVTGDFDVIVCDGFVGNVILKTCEGVAKIFGNIIKKEIKSKFSYSLGGVLCKGAFDNVKKRFDYREIGGAPFLGLKALVVKAHGSSDAKAIKNAIGQSYKFIEANIVEKIADALSK